MFFLNQGSMQGRLHCPPESQGSMQGRLHCPPEGQVSMQGCLHCPQEREKIEVGRGTLFLGILQM